MAGMNNIGWLYPKKVNTVQLTNDSAWEVVAAVAIPPYVVCEQYWLNCTASSVGTVQTYQSMNYAIKGIYFSVSPNDDPQEDNILSIVNEYCPPDSDEWADGDTGAGDNSGETDLPGAMPVGTTFQNSQFFTRERVLSIADGTSMITSASSDTGDLTYIDHFTTKGNPYKKTMGMKMDDAKYMVFIARTEQDGTTSDWSDVATGHQSSWQNFTNILWNTFGVNTDASVVEHAMGVGALNAGVKSWLTQGYHDTDSTVGANMLVNSRLSLKCKVVLPKSGRHISGG